MLSVGDADNGQEEQDSSCTYTVNPTLSILLFPTTEIC
jgi:hypothetical protein